MLRNDRIQTVCVKAHIFLSNRKMQEDRHREAEVWRAGIPEGQVISCMIEPAGIFRNRFTGFV